MLCVCVWVYVDMFILNMHKYKCVCVLTCIVLHRYVLLITDLLKTYKDLTTDFISILYCNAHEIEMFFLIILNIGTTLGCVMSFIYLSPTIMVQEVQPGDRRRDG